MIRSKSKSGRSGYTIFEIVLVVTFLGILSIMTIPRFFDLSDEAKRQVELSQIAAIRHGVAIYGAESGALTRNPFYPEQLDDAAVGEGAPNNILFVYVLENGIEQNDWSKLDALRYAAPSGDVYAYNPADGQFQLSDSLTPLGSTFPEITDGMIDLIQAYFDENGSYPRSWGDYRYTDIGLDPAVWDNVPYNGLIYRPSGNRVSIKPGEGYSITVMGQDGSLRTLTPDLNWNIWYDANTQEWYYHSIEAGQEVDIDTIDVQTD